LDDALVQSATAQLGGTGEQNRARIGTGESDAQVDELAVVFSQRDRDAGDRIFNRAANADLVIGRAQACRVLGARGSDQLARPQREIIFAVALSLGDGHVLAGEADIKLLEWKCAFARWACDVNLGAEREQGGGEVAAERCETDAAA